MQYLLLLLLTISYCINAFIPHPLLADGGDASDSISHAEITQFAFIRSLARYFYDTQIRSNIAGGIGIDEQTFFSTEYTIDQLYKIAHPEYSETKIKLISLPLKYNLDRIMMYNAFVDFDTRTKKLSEAHFDSEAFFNGSRRILKLRKSKVQAHGMNTVQRIIRLYKRIQHTPGRIWQRTKNNKDAVLSVKDLEKSNLYEAATFYFSTLVISQISKSNQDFTETQKLLGQLFHTLQDFYSHSNWIEMGKTNINSRIGVYENIGPVAAPKQATCKTNICERKEKACTFWQHVTLRNCPLVYYDCQNNIIQEINEKNLLTSGYLFDQFDQNNNPINKPTDTQKCSHGSVLDDSSHVPAIGGINKDSNNLIFSPHSILHYKAVDFAVDATEEFLNNLRKEIGDAKFDRLFTIHPTQSESDAARRNDREFRLFTPNLASRVRKFDDKFTSLKNWIRNRFNLIKSILDGLFPDAPKHTMPTYDLNDLGYDIKDKNNFRAAPYVLDIGIFGRKKRLIDILKR